MVRDLTPYDTGERAEPNVWPVIRGSARDDYGKVDFDADDSATIATVWVERRGTEGGYTLKGYGHGNDITIDIAEIDDGWDNTVPRELADVLNDRETEASVRAAEWLKEHESDDFIWELIGGLLDRIEEMAAEADQ